MEYKIALIVETNSGFKLETPAGVFGLIPGQVFPKHQPKPLAFAELRKGLSMDLERSSSPKP